MYSLEHVQSHVETAPYVSVHIMYGPVLLEYVAAPLRPAPLDPDGSTCHEMSGAPVCRQRHHSVRHQHALRCDQDQGNLVLRRPTPLQVHQAVRAVPRDGRFGRRHGDGVTVTPPFGIFQPRRASRRRRRARVARVHCCGCGSAFLDSASSATMVVRGGLRDVVTRGWF